MTASRGDNRATAADDRTMTTEWALAPPSQLSGAAARDMLERRRRGGPGAACRSPPPMAGPLSGSGGGRGSSSLACHREGMRGEGGGSAAGRGQGTLAERPPICSPSSRFRSPASTRLKRASPGFDTAEAGSCGSERAPRHMTPAPPTQQHVPGLIDTKFQTTPSRLTNDSFMLQLMLRSCGKLHICRAPERRMQIRCVGILHVSLCVQLISSSHQQTQTQRGAASRGPEHRTSRQGCLCICALLGVPASAAGPAMASAAAAHGHWCQFLDLNTH